MAIVAPFNEDLQAVTAEGSHKYSIDYQTLRYNLSHDSQQVSVSIHALIPPDGPIAFAQAMMGHTSYDNATKKLVRKVPEQLPIKLKTSLTKYYCTQCNIAQIFENGSITGNYNPKFVKPQPDSSQNNWPKPRFARFECVFSTLAYDVLTDAEIDNRSEWTTESAGRNESLRYTIIDEEIHEENERSQPGEVVLRIKIPGADDRAMALGEVSAVRSGYRRLRVQWLQLPKLPSEATMAAMMGKVNKTEIKLREHTIPAEKALLVSYETATKTDLAGDRHYNRTYILNVRTDERSWNEFRRPGGGLAEAWLWKNRDFDKPVWDRKLYAGADFSKLFKFD